MGFPAVPGSHCPGPSSGSEPVPSLIKQVRWTEVSLRHGGAGGEALDSAKGKVDCDRSDHQARQAVRTRPVEAHLTHPALSTFTVHPKSSASTLMGRPTPSPGLSPPWHPRPVPGPAPDRPIPRADALWPLVGSKLPPDFPGGAVVKNPPASAGDTGSSPGPGRSHMPRSN